MTDWGQYLSHMRATAPLIQNITNFVAMNVMANALLASGASPAMLHAEEEAAEFAAIASALTINIGTLSTDWVRGMIVAAESANDNDTPWVLDPVAAGATAFRRETSAALVALNPSVIRGNASEILALCGAMTKGKGADSSDSVNEAQEGARALASSIGGVVAVTGPEDFITDGQRAYRVQNGHPMMPLVTALGCTLNGVIASFIVGQPHLEATAAAIAYYGLAGQIAAETTAAPGSFATAFIDALYAITPDQLASAARIQPE
ncbi:hydroxyethylthiazole kinase [uncultured Cohaesibacter sp.]|uniref:hydroxyethylthiazole kinase n=1 Tax=uncultured Cohaesibacter sp. TaxID=1002546 RepID=UPI0029C98B33|nr:hydroxyethylthiazole kinase [uncultured Cohaesibacter sp.]